MNRQKEAELRKALHDIASTPPSCDPFASTGAQVWQEWSEGCRSVEKELIDAGVEL